MCSDNDNDSLLCTPEEFGGLCKSRERWKHAGGGVGAETGLKSTALKTFSYFMTRKERGMKDSASLNRQGRFICTAWVLNIGHSKSFPNGQIKEHRKQYGC